MLNMEGVIVGVERIGRIDGVGRLETGEVATGKVGKWRLGAFVVDEGACGDGASVGEKDIAGVTDAGDPTAADGEEVISNIDVGPLDD
jgi:hypothetical protein